MLNSKFVVSTIALVAGMALYVNGINAQSVYESKHSTVKKVVVTVDVETDDGRQLKLQSKPSTDIKAVLGSARALIIDSFTIGSDMPEPVAAIFHCGGDIEQSDGTCNDVIAKCATIGLEFGCNPGGEGPEGTCTNGGC